MLPILAALNADHRFTVCLGPFFVMYLAVLWRSTPTAAVIVIVYMQ